MDAEDSRMNRGFSSEFDSQNKKSSSLGKLFIFFILFILLVGGAYLFGGGKIASVEKKITQLFSDTSKPTKQKTIVPIASPTLTIPSVITPTIVPSVSPEPSPTVVKTQPTITKTPVTNATGLDRSKLTIEVDNGSGIVGAAGKMSDTLKKLGYTVSGTGNADNFNYTTTNIQVKKSMSDYLPQLKADLSTTYTIGSSSATLDSSVSSDAIVIVGKQ